MHLNTLGLILTLICGLLLVPCASSAQQADKVWRIGLFHVASTTSSVSPRFAEPSRRWAMRGKNLTWTGGTCPMRQRPGRRPRSSSSSASI